jgi:hypothetical protein
MLRGVSGGQRKRVTTGMIHSFRQIWRLSGEWFIFQSLSHRYEFTKFPGRISIIVVVLLGNLFKLSLCR